MNIAVFTKIHMAGGSEFRAAELSSAIQRYTEHNAFLISSDSAIPEKVMDRVDSKVEIIEDIFNEINPLVERFYEMDCIIVINTDSKHFTKLDYWEGRSDQHKHFVDLTRIPQMHFIFNFLVSPAEHLWQLDQKCGRVGILPTNRRFYDEIGSKDKHKRVRHLPRMILESPIDHDSVSPEKTNSDKIRIGKHSKGMGNKWSVEHQPLILSINKDYEDKVEWDFMGTSGEVRQKIKGIPNVTCRKEFEKSVRDYLADIDILLFFIDFKRQEPFARVVGEAMASGCPILATGTDGGNRMQVVDGSNGFLCNSTNDFYEKIKFFIENPEMIKKMGQNSILYSKFFSSEAIIDKLMKFVET